MTQGDVYVKKTIKHITLGQKTGFNMGCNMKKDIGE
jgi:hypothetical protein